MTLNPLEKNEKDDISHYQFAWQKSISPEHYEKIKEGINIQISNAIKMCELPEIKVTFKENSYLNR